MNKKIITIMFSVTIITFFVSLLIYAIATGYLNDVFTYYLISI